MGKRGKQRGQAFSPHGPTLAEVRSPKNLEIMKLQKLRCTRREILKHAAMAALAAPAMALGRTTPQPDTAAKAATFVLVHGAWHGG